MGGGARLHCGRPELGPMVHGCNGRVKCHQHPDPFVSGIPASSGSVVSLPPLFCPCPCSPSCDLSPSSSVAALSCCCSGCSGRWWWWHWVGGWWQAGWWHRLLCTPAVSSRGKQQPRETKQPCCEFQVANMVEIFSNKFTKTSGFPC